MNINDFRLNAYKKAGKQTSELSDSNKTIKKLTNQAQNTSFTREDSNIHFQKKASSVSDIKKFEGDYSTQVAAKALVSGGLIKVPEQPREADGRENIYRRVAKFLLLIGVDEAAKILPHLSEEQTEKIIPEIASIRHVASDEAEEILNEFKSLVQKSREEGGVDTARNILEKAFGRERAEEMLEKAVPLNGGKPFEYLLEADSERVSMLLKDESNPVRTLVLSHLKPKVAAEVINQLSDEDKKDVVIRLAKMKDVSPEIIKRVDSAMQEKMNLIAASKADVIDGRSTLAQILKRMNPDAEQEILDNLSVDDPELGADLRERLFTIEDVLNADNKYIQEYLRKMDEEEIAYLIAQKENSFRNKILFNVSENRRKAVLESEEFLKPMRKSDCEKATSKFFMDLRRAYEEGKLIIDGRDDEIYV